MRTSLFSNIIKQADQEQPAIKPYAMRDVSLQLDFQEGKTRFARSLFRSSSDSAKGTKQLLEEIREREKYIKQVTDKTHNVEKEGYEKGFAQGEKAGRELGEKRFDSVVKSFAEVLEEVRRLKEELYQQGEQEMIKLVLAIARRVIQKEVSTDEKIILAMIQSALKYIADQGEIRVKLNPSDLEYASQHKGEIMEGVRQVIFEGDEGISRGDAIIESNRGVIDCGIEKHLQEVEEALKTQVEENAQVKGEEEIKEEKKEEVKEKDRKGE